MIGDVAYQGVVNVLPGDVGFADQRGFVNWWIRFAQRRKYGTGPAARWNHTFMVTGIGGELVQAESSGMARGHLSDYNGQEFVVLRPFYADRADIAAAAIEELLTEHDRYGFLTIASVAISLLTGTRLRFGLSGTEICSGAVAYALTRANVDMGPDCEFDTPADVYATALTQRWVRV